MQLDLYLCCSPIPLSLTINQNNIAKSEQSSHTPSGAIRGHTTLIGNKEKWRNKRTDKQYVAEFFLHSTTCHI